MVECYESEMEALGYTDGSVLKLIGTSLCFNEGDHSIVPNIA